MKKEWEKITEGGDSVAMWQSIDGEYHIELFEHCWDLKRFSEEYGYVDYGSTSRLINNSDEDMTPQLAFEVINNEDLDVTDFLLS